MSNVNYNVYILLKNAINETRVSTPQQIIEESCIALINVRKEIYEIFKTNPGVKKFVGARTNSIVDKVEYIKRFLKFENEPPRKIKTICFT